MWPGIAWFGFEWPWKLGTLQAVAAGSPNVLFGFLNVCLFPTGGFFTFLVALAHGVAWHSLVWLGFEWPWKLGTLQAVAAGSVGSALYCVLRACVMILHSPAGPCDQQCLIS